MIFKIGTPYRVKEAFTDHEDNKLDLGEVYVAVAPGMLVVPEKYIKFKYGAASINYLTEYREYFELHESPIEIIRRRLKS